MGEGCHDGQTWSARFGGQDRSQLRVRKIAYREIDATVIDDCDTIFLSIQCPIKRAWQVHTAHLVFPIILALAAPDADGRRCLGADCIDPLESREVCPRSVGRRFWSQVLVVDDRPTRPPGEGVANRHLWAEMTSLIGMSCDCGGVRSMAHTAREHECRRSLTDGNMGTCAVRK